MEQVLDADKRMREMLGEHFQRVLGSDKVKDSGLLCGKRGGFFIVEVDVPEELFELLGPEIYANFETDVQPLAPMERSESDQSPRSGLIDLKKLHDLKDQGVAKYTLV